MSSPFSSSVGMSEVAVERQRFSDLLRRQMAKATVYNNMSTGMNGMGGMGMCMGGMSMPMMSMRAQLMMPMRSRPSACGPVGFFSEATAMTRKMILESAVSAASTSFTRCNPPSFGRIGAIDRSPPASLPSPKFENATMTRQHFEPYHPDAFHDALLEKEARRAVEEVHRCEIVSQSSSGSSSVDFRVLDDDDDDDESAESSGKDEGSLLRCKVRHSSCVQEPKSISSKKKDDFGDKGKRKSVVKKSKLAGIEEDTSDDERDGLGLGSGSGSSSKTSTEKGIESEEENSFIPEIDVPKRRRSAYNLFFQHERARLLILSEDDENLEDHPPRCLSIEEVRRLLDNNPYFTDRSKRRHRKSHGKVSFMGLVKTVSTSWKGVDETTKRSFEALAAEDQERYRKEWAEYKTKCRKVRRKALNKAARLNKRRKGENIVVEVDEKNATGTIEKRDENSRYEVSIKSNLGINGALANKERQCRRPPVKKRKLEAAAAASARRTSIPQMSPFEGSCGGTVAFWDDSDDGQLRHPDEEISRLLSSQSPDETQGKNAEEYHSNSCHRPTVGQSQDLIVTDEHHDCLAPEFEVDFLHGLDDDADANSLVTA